MSKEARSIGPEYKRVAAGIEAAIIAGEYPIGQPIPSTKKLEALYGVSSTVIRKAVDRLQDAGVLVGHPGKGVYVLAPPGEDADVQAELARLTGQVEELKSAAAGVPDIMAALQRVEDSISRVEGNLMDLYGKNGFTYPHGGESAGAGSSSHPQAAPRAKYA